MELKVTEVLEDGEWVEVDFMDLKEGDIFRLWESADVLETDEDGGNTWVCTSDAYIMSGEDYDLDEDTPGVECDPVEI